jgi:hypothetical protein
VLAAAILILMAGSTGAQEPAARDDPDRPVTYRTDFAGDDGRWEMSDPGAWQWNDGGWLSLHRKDSSYQPPVRSPLHLALLQAPEFGDFTLDVRVRSTHDPYGHRDVCVFFGYQAPDRFYYVHLGQQTDDHCNQIFIVDAADRRKISSHTSPGTPWDDQWHRIRIERDVARGDIRVYFDDMERPVMQATDKTLTRGRIGLGSFDDTADFDDLSVRDRQ